MKFRISVKPAFLAVMFIAVSVFQVNVFAESAVPVKKYELKNGIPVYVKDGTVNKLAAVYIIVKGGVQYLTPETSGLEDALFSMMTMGSKKYSYDDVQYFEYKTLSSFKPDALETGAVLSINTIDHYFDQALDILTDGFMNPAFGSMEYDNLTAKYRQQIQSNLNDPTALVMYNASKAIYRGHPYAAAVSVSPESLANITLDAIKNHHRQILDSRRISIAAAGCIDPEHLVEELNKTIGTIPAGKMPLKYSKPAPVKVSGEPLVMVHQSAAGTGFIMRAFASPPVTSSDYVPACIASDIFSEILYNVVREKHGACYSPSTFVLGSEAPYGVEFIYRASNLNDFAEYMAEARQIMEKQLVISGTDKKGFKFEPLSSRLEGYINAYISRKYSSQSSTNGVAVRMCTSLLLGDISLMDNMIEEAKAVTVEDIERVFKRYWLDESSRWFAVVGPDGKDKINFQF